MMDVDDQLEAGTFTSELKRLVGEQPPKEEEDDEEVVMNGKNCTLVDDGSQSRIISPFTHQNQWNNCINRLYDYTL